MSGSSTATGSNDATLPSFGSTGDRERDKQRERQLGRADRRAQEEPRPTRRSRSTALRHELAGDFLLVSVTGRGQRREHLRARTARWTRVAQTTRGAAQPRSRRRPSGASAPARGPRPISSRSSRARAAGSRGVTRRVGDRRPLHRCRSDHADRHLGGCDRPAAQPRHDTHRSVGHDDCQLTTGSSACTGRRRPRSAPAPPSRRRAPRQQPASPMPRRPPPARAASTTATSGSNAGWVAQTRRAPGQPQLDLNRSPSQQRRRRLPARVDHRRRARHRLHLCAERRLVGAGPAGHSGIRGYVDHPGDLPELQGRSRCRDVRLHVPLRCLPLVRKPAFGNSRVGGCRPLHRRRRGDADRRLAGRRRPSAKSRHHAHRPGGHGDHHERAHRPLLRHRVHVARRGHGQPGGLLDRHRRRRMPPRPRPGSALRTPRRAARATTGSLRRWLSIFVRAS